MHAQMSSRSWWKVTALLQMLIFYYVSFIDMEKHNFCNNENWVEFHKFTKSLQKRKQKQEEESSMEEGFISIDSSFCNLYESVLKKQSCIGVISLMFVF